MSTAAAHDHEEPAPEKQEGTFRFTPEEEEEMVEIIAEADEDERAGRLRPIGELTAKLRRSPCAR